MVTISIPGTLLAVVGAAMLALAMGTVLTMLDRLDTWRQRRRVQGHSIRSSAQPVTQPQSGHRRIRTHASVLSTSRHETSPRDHEHTSAPRAHVSATTLSRLREE